MADGTLTVRELVEETDLGLRLVAGGAAKDRLVTGVHISEIPDPTRWLAPRTVLLSTGIILKDEPALGVELIRKLAAADTAALGIDPYLYLHGVMPQAMCAEADALGLPFFSIPLETPFRAITAYVHSSLISRDFHSLRRSLSVQNHLLGQLLEDRGLGHLIASLSMLLSTTAILFDRSGHVLAQAQSRVKASDGFLTRIWEAYLERHPDNVERQSFLVGENRIDYREVTHRNRMEQVLCLVRLRSQPLPDFTEVILSYAQKLLTLDLLRSQDSLLLRKRLQAGLLDELISGDGHPRELADRARHHGFDPESPWRVMVVQSRANRRQETARGPATSVAADPGELLANLDAHLSLTTSGFLSMLRGEDAVVLLPTAEPLAEVRVWLDGVCSGLQEHNPGGTLHAGLSERYQSVEKIPAALAQASEALATSSPAAQMGIAAFADLGPRARVLENQTPDRLRCFVESTILPLQEYDREHGTDLVQSLEVYLNLNRSVSETAARLFVHRNTLRNRLQKVEEILGSPVESTETLVDLYLGFKASRLLEGQ